MAKLKEPLVMSLPEVIEKLRTGGFQVSTTGSNQVRVEGGACAAVLELDARGIRFADPPGYLIGGEIARLLDRGYQKYLQTSKTRVPALAEHLKAMHDFGTKMRAALGIPSLYNESLGTVSDRYLYDRVAGRGDAPPHGVWGTNLRR